MSPFPRRETPDHGPALSQALKAVRRHRKLRAVDVAEAMGLALRSFEHFEGGRGRANLDRIWRFASVVDCDPLAILIAMLFRRPEFAVRAADNKLGLILQLALQDFNDALGDDIARLDARTLISAFGRTFEELRTATIPPDLGPDPKSPPAGEKDEPERDERDHPPDDPASPDD